MQGYKPEMQATIVVFDPDGGVDLEVKFKEKYGTTRTYMCTTVSLQDGKYYVRTMDADPIAILDSHEWSIITVTDYSKK